MSSGLLACEQAIQCCGVCHAQSGDKPGSPNPSDAIKLASMFRPPYRRTSYRLQYSIVDVVCRIRRGDASRTCDKFLVASRILRSRAARPSATMSTRASRDRSCGPGRSHGRNTKQLCFDRCSSNSETGTTVRRFSICMCAIQESNLGPLEYQSSALPAELIAHLVIYTLAGTS
jgi:hypothetical protein